MLRRSDLVALALSLPALACGRSPFDGQFFDCAEPVSESRTLEFDFVPHRVFSLRDGTFAITTRGDFELHIGDPTDGGLQRYRPDEDVTARDSQVVHVDEDTLYIVTNHYSNEREFHDRLWRFDRDKESLEELDLGLPEDVWFGQVAVHKDGGLAVGWMEPRHSPEDTLGYISFFEEDLTPHHTTALPGYRPFGSMLAVGEVSEDTAYVLVHATIPFSVYHGQYHMLAVGGGYSLRAIIGSYTDIGNTLKKVDRVLYEEVDFSSDKFFVFGADDIWDPDLPSPLTDLTDPDAEFRGDDRRSLFVEGWEGISTRWRLDDVRGTRDGFHVMDAEHRGAGFVAVAVYEHRTEEGSDQYLTVYRLGPGGQAICRTEAELPRGFSAWDGSAVISGRTILARPHGGGEDSPKTLLAFEL